MIDEHSEIVEDTKQRQQGLLATIPTYPRQEIRKRSAPIASIRYIYLNM